MADTGVLQHDRSYTQAPAQVWAALTTPKLHARWWAPGDVRAEVGHRFELDMGAWGKQTCEVLAVEPARLFRYVFSVGGLNTTITFRLEPEGTGTRLWFTQEGFDLTHPMGQRAFEGMKPGWPHLLQKLATVA